MARLKWEGLDGGRRCVLNSKKGRRRQTDSQTNRPELKRVGLCPTRDCFFYSVSVEWHRIPGRLRIKCGRWCSLPTRRSFSIRISISGLTLNSNSAQERMSCFFDDMSAFGTRKEKFQERGKDMIVTMRMHESMHCNFCNALLCKIVFV